MNQAALGALGASSWLAKRRAALARARKKAQDAVEAAQDRGYIVPTTSAAEAGVSAYQGRTRLFEKIPTWAKAGAVAFIPGVGPMISAGIIGKSFIDKARDGSSSSTSSVGTSTRKPGRGGVSSTHPSNLVSPTDAVSSSTAMYPGTESTAVAPSTPSYGLLGLGALLLLGAGYAIYKRVRRKK